MNRPKSRTGIAVMAGTIITLAAVLLVFFVFEDALSGA
jgi:hypothetical protein